MRQPDLRRRAQQREGSAAVITQLAGLESCAVAERDAAHADLAEVVAGLVEDFERGLLALVIAHIEKVLLQRVGPGAGLESDFLAVHKEAHANPAFNVATTEPDVDEIALNGEGRARELACRRVIPLGQVAVDQARAFAADVAHRFLHGVAGNRPWAKGVALHGPGGEGVAVPILENNVGPGCPGISSGRIEDTRAAHDGDVRIPLNQIPPRGVDTVAIVEAESVFQRAGQGRLDRRG